MLVAQIEDWQQLNIIFFGQIQVVNVVHTYVHHRFLSKYLYSCRWNNNFSFKQKYFEDNGFYQLTIIGMFRWVLLMMFTISTTVQIHLLMYYMYYLFCIIYNACFKTWKQNSVGNVEYEIILKTISRTKTACRRCSGYMVLVIGIRHKSKDGSW